MRGSPTLRSLGTACVVIGALGLVILGVAYLMTELSSLGAMVPLLGLLVALGLLFRWQARRR